MGNGAPVLSVDGVAKTYRPPPRLLRPLMRTAVDEPVPALTDVTFSVAPGEIVGLLGPNGAGKTSLIRIIATLLTPSAGRVTVCGHDIATEDREVRQSIGLVLSDDRGLYWRLDGRRNLEFFGVMAGLAPHEATARADELLADAGLAEVDKRVFGYSNGMRARLSLARALLGEPQFLLLDEPTRGLDPLAARRVGEQLRATATTGTGVLLSSHRLEDVAQVCDRVVILVDGRVRFDGSVATAAEDVGGAAGLSELLERAAGEAAGTPGDEA